MNQSKITTITNHFRLNFNFYEPYQVILDGNFIKLMVQRNQPFQRKLQLILNGKVFTKVTECILRELQVLGQRFKFVFGQAKKQQLIKCKHFLGVTPKQCIEELIGQENQKKYMVCTQDMELRRFIRQLPNVPIFYFGPDQRITMQQIQYKHKIELQKTFQIKMLPKYYQSKPIQHFKKQRQEQLKTQKKKLLLKQVSMQGIQIKKIAKGPNPLSIKKKKVQKIALNQIHTDEIEQENQIVTEPVIEKQKRIRKRKRKNSNRQ